MSVVTVTGREMPFWLGNIPSGWEVVPTKRVMTVVKQTPGQGKVDDYDRLSLTMQGVLPRSKDDRNGLQPVDFDAYQILRPGQLVFKLIDLMNVSTSRVGLSHHTGLVSPAYIVVSPGPKVEARFAHYYFRDLYSRRIFNLLGSVGVRSSLGPRDLMGLEFLLPPLDEQRAIADYLDQETIQIDALVAKQEELLRFLAERKKSVIDHVLATMDGEPRRLRWLFQPSGVANAPNEEVLSVYRDHGVVPKSSRSDNFNKTPESVDRYLLVQPGDLVINKMKAWQGSLGISRFRGIVSGDYEVLRPIAQDLDSRFAHFILRSPQMVLEYRARSRGIRPSQWRLYWQDFADIEIVIPQLEQQRRAATQIEVETDAIDTLISKANEHIALAKERRSALITAAVTGQLDVSTARRGA